MSSTSSPSESQMYEAIILLVKPLRGEVGL